MAKEKKLGTSIIAEKLFPDGNIVMPTAEDFAKKIKSNTFTVRDALILHLNDAGFRIGEGELRESALAEQVRDIFKKSTISLTTMKNKVTALEDILDRNYFEVTKNIVDQAGVEEFNRLIGKQVGLIIQAVDGSVSEFAKSRNVERPVKRETISKVKQPRGGKAFKLVPEPKIVWPAIMEAAQNMAVDPKYGPEVAKNFLLAAIVPLRNSDLGQITTNKQFAQGLETVRPYIFRMADGTLGITLPGLTDEEKMAGRGHKGAPQIKLTKFLSNLLEVDFKTAFDKQGNVVRNYLFDHKKVTTSKMTNAVKAYFAPLLKPYEDGVLGRPVRGIADVRKIASSTIAKHPDVKSPAIASQLLGHTSEASYLEGITKLEAASYISDIYEEGAEDKITKALTLYESLITKTISPTNLDINQIARIAGLPLNDEKTAIDIIESVTQEQTTKKLSSEEIKQNKILEAKNRKLALARKDEQIAEAGFKTQQKLLKTAETKKKRLELGEVEDKVVKGINFSSPGVNYLIDKFNISDAVIDQIKALPPQEQADAFSGIIAGLKADRLEKESIKYNKDSGKPEGQEFRADDLQEDKKSFLDYRGISGTGITLRELGVAATDPENLKKLASAAIGIAGSMINPLKKPKQALQVGKFLFNNVIRPGSTQEAAVDLSMTLQDKAREEFKQTPEYQEYMKNKEAKEKQKAAMDLFGTETAIQEDMNRPEDERTIGDDDPDSWQNRRVQDQMSELLF